MNTLQGDDRADFPAEGWTSPRTVATVEERAAYMVGRLMQVHGLPYEVILSLFKTEIVAYAYGADARIVVFDKDKKARAKSKRARKARRKNR